MTAVLSNDSTDRRPIVKESQVITAEKRIMTGALEATDKDFEQMRQMLTGFWVTQIAGAGKRCDRAVGSS